jgi:hypothetical protein
MLATPTMNIVFSGSDAEQAIARDAMSVLQHHGRFMAADAPITVKVAALTALLVAQRGVAAANVAAALAANPANFHLAGEGDEQTVSTTRAGLSPVSGVEKFSHSFAKRFMTPKPKPEMPPQPIYERPRVAPNWGLETVFEGEDFEEGFEVEGGEPAVVAAPAIIAPAAAAVVAPVVEEVEQPVVEAPAPRTITVQTTPSTDVSGVDDLELAATIADRLRADPRVVEFGEMWMLEDRVPRFSRGDLRRMKEYIVEQEQPLTDDMLVQDVIGVRPGSPEFDLMRFAVNVRLSREHRDFDFVGTLGQRFWSTSSLPPIGTTRRKPNEIGTDLRYLVDEVTTAPAPRSVASVDHVLTFYEYYLGMLPYDEQLQALLPAPLQPNQRSTVLTFECPQSYTTYLVELRYPTPNRGGFVLGLDDFFTENLIPGALIAISRTENDGHYKVEYLPASSQSGRLLELEDRKQRYMYRPTTYACEVEESMLISEERFPRLSGEKPLDDKGRRRAESVVASAFERIGDMSEGHGYSASFTDLLAVANIERPFSEAYLRAILDNDESGAFAKDPDSRDVYTYVPGNPA